MDSLMQGYLICTPSPVELFEARFHIAITKPRERS
jgi:hypothetical protein